MPFHWSVWLLLLLYGLLLVVLALRVVMPKSAVPAKIAACRAYGAEVHLVGAVGEAERTHRGVEGRERRVLRHTQATVHLHGNTSAASVPLALISSAAFSQRSRIVRLDALPRLCLICSAICEIFLSPLSNSILTISWDIGSFRPGTMTSGDISPYLW